MDERTLTGLDWGIVCEALRNRCHTLLGQRHALNGDFAVDREDALKRYTSIQELWDLDAEGEHPPVASVHDIQDLSFRAEKGEVLEPEELVDIGNTLGALHRLRTWVHDRAERAPVLHELVSPIQIDIFLLRNLEDSFDPSGALSDELYPELRTIRRRMEQLRQQVRSKLESMLQDPSIADLFQDKYITDRGGRLVLPVRVHARKAVGIVHDTSQSGETAFVEPSAVVDQQNELKGLEAELRRTISRILTELSREVGEHHNAIVAGLKAATEVDLSQARAQLGLALDCTVPNVGIAGVISIDHARHPGLALRGIDVIPNSLRIDDQNCGVVLTGPNAGGKTITLKTAGLFAVMVRAGLPVPAADGARVDWMECIVAIVGDQQDISDDLSTFSSHLVGLRMALESAQMGALILLDELGVGTDPAQGAALAQAIVETLVESRARTIVTTHYDSLKQCAAEHPSMTLMGAVFADGKPTFRMEPDRVGRSHALAVARRMGLSETVIERARALLDEESRRIDDLLTEVENERENLRTLRHSLEESQRKAAFETQRLHEREQRLNARRDREDAADRIAFRERLREQERALKEMIRSLQDAPSLRQAHTALNEVKSARDQARPVSPDVEHTDAHPLQPGDRVKMVDLGSAGTVVNVQGDRIEVEIRGKRMRMHRNQLRYAPARGNTHTKPKTKPIETGERSTGPTGVRTQSNTIDLRGMRVEEALDAVEAFLDEMVLTENGSAFLLHGHGTGALKTALRQWLPKSKYGNQWQRGGPDDGGDAFTVVHL